MREHIQPEQGGLRRIEQSGLKRSAPSGLRSLSKKEKNAPRAIPVQFNCDINTKKFTINGEIEIVSGGGYAAAQCDFDRASLPYQFQPELLSYIAITGYPDASLKIGAAQNPFSDQKADFETIRLIRLPDIEGSLHADYRSIGRGTPNERIEFNVHGEAYLDKRIVSIKPLCELWTPSEKPDMFEGSMAFIWQLDDGEDLFGHALGSYTIPSRIPLTRPQMRVISFELETGPNSFRQVEKIKLFDLDEWNAG